MHYQDSWQSCYYNSCCFKFTSTTLLLFVFLITIVVTIHINNRCSSVSSAKIIMMIMIQFTKMVVTKYNDYSKWLTNAIVIISCTITINIYNSQPLCNSYWHQLWKLWTAVQPIFHIQPFVHEMVSDGDYSCDWKLI